MPRYVVEKKDTNSNKVVLVALCNSKSAAERVDTMFNINLDTSKFYTVVRLAVESDLGETI